MNHPYHTFNEQVKKILNFNSNSNWRWKDRKPLNRYTYFQLNKETNKKQTKPILNV